MLRPDGKRQASVGEEGLVVPDHQTQDNNVRLDPRQSRASRDYSEPTKRFDNERPGMTDQQEGSFRNSNKSSGLGSRHSISRMDQFDGSSNDSAQAQGLGQNAAFRSAIAARRWLNQSRRSLLREKQQRESSRASIQANPELAPLNHDGAHLSGTIPEENDNGDGAPKYHTLEAIKSIIVGKTVSVFLLLIPFAIWSVKAGWGANYVFWLNFLVMIPLASILGDFTEEAALHTNETIGGLLNATFGNAVEVVVAIQALLANEIRVVQASMIGSIFSNLLLVLGCCFFFGGLYYKEQTFNSTAATANMGLLALSSIALVLPTPFAEYYNVQDEHVLVISRFAAMFLLFMYIQLLIFQLHTHKDIFDEIEVVGTKASSDLDDDAGEIRLEAEEEASMSLPVALIGLGITTLSVTFFSDYLVESIDDFCDISGISRTFVGLIILPIVGNAVEHITAVTVAMKNKMDLAMGGTSLNHPQ